MLRRHLTRMVVIGGYGFLILSTWVTVRIAHMPQHSESATPPATFQATRRPEDSALPTLKPVSTPEAQPASAPGADTPAPDTSTSEIHPQTPGPQRILNPPVPAPQLETDPTVQPRPVRRYAPVIRAQRLQTLTRLIDPLTPPIPLLRPCVLCIRLCGYRAGACGLLFLLTRRPIRRSVRSLTPRKTQTYRY